MYDTRVWLEDITRMIIVVTLWWTNIAMENGPVEIVDFPIKNGDFP